MSETFMPLVGWDRDGSPFHEGELAIQRRLGILTAAADTS
jgi:hypothetical protein